MDPDSNLEMQRRLAARLIAMLDRSIPFEGKDIPLFVDTANELAEHVEALDGWLKAGGMLPKAWAFEGRTVRRA